MMPSTLSFKRIVVMLVIFSWALCGVVIAQENPPKRSLGDEDDATPTATNQLDSADSEIPSTDHSSSDHLTVESTDQVTAPIEVTAASVSPVASPSMAPAAATLVAQMVGDDTVLTPAPDSHPQPESTITAKPEDAVVEPDVDDFAKLKLDMAISSFKLNPDGRTRMMLIDAYQGLVLRECYSQVYKNLTITPPGTPQCQLYVGKLLQVESQNPLAICAREGFDSIGCRNAYRAQSFRSFSERSTDTELDQVLDLKRNEEELNRIQNKISDLRSNYETHKDAESRAAFITAVEQAIEKACRTISEGPADQITDSSELFRKYPELAKLVSGDDGASSSSDGSLVNMIEATIPAEVQPSPTSVQKPYAGLLRDLGKQVEQENVPITRYRNASPFCYNFVSQLLDIEPNHPRATCLRDGPYSPGCLLAVKRQRQTPPTARPGATAAPRRNTAGGLATF